MNSAIKRELNSLSTIYGGIATQVSQQLEAVEKMLRAMPHHVEFSHGRLTLKKWNDSWRLFVDNTDQQVCRAKIETKVAIVADIEPFIEAYRDKLASEIQRLQALLQQMPADAEKLMGEAPKP